jgi:uncharacterized membrane protein
MRGTGIIQKGIKQIYPAPGCVTSRQNLKGEFWTMKKLLTMLFTVALALSLSSFAFAQDAGTADKKDDAKKEEKAEKKAAKKHAKKEKKEKKAEEKKDDMAK